MQQQGQNNQPTPKQFFEEAHRLLKMGDVFEAARRAGKLRAHFPDDTPILALHGIVLARLGLHAQALTDLIRAAQVTEEALRNDEDGNPARPRIVDQLIRLSVDICRCSVAIGEFDAAEEAIENALGWDPDRADAVGAKAEMLAAQGEIVEAKRIIAEGFKEQLDSRPLVLARARILLLETSPSKDELREVVSEIQSESEVSGVSATDLGELLRSLGLIHDLLGQHDDAFNAFRRAARLRRGKFDPRNYTVMTTKVISDWSLDAMSKVIKPEHNGTGFVLMLGAPMSGVNQLADMIGQLDEAVNVGPVETLSAIGVQQLNARQGVLRPVPLAPQKFRRNQLEDAGAAYIEQLQAIASGSTGLYIDTHPLNIPNAGAAALMLPGLKVVMCRRDPVEAALACYCDEMPGNHPYSGELLSAAGFVADSNRMMDHWAKVLSDESIGAQVIEVQYSDLASEPKKTAARVARELGIDAKAPDIKRVPHFASGPGSHVEDYKNYPRQIRDLLEPASA